ncbi:hypothetical protein [Polaromonas sp. 35-63-35]|jgi:hypothetical protein|nr:hypothetical protein [Polaromonas sp. 35-63-35]
MATQQEFLRNAAAQALIDMVMDHCAAITLRRIKNGELSLLPNRF